ncbi:MAG TPA: hypothetical protein PLM14_14520 [Candidatus Hydrogenedentes bacterium]|nr:hypothetical protein [Candidatus Hydrogenedentota bacterium]HQE84213.1 hypothetical protein [Candidatus Hydrogenedentota bacterium]HQH54668.1 hypothetical protein [Candidatus Hydrogenedentota bacterium]HQM51439.1 hypothetical protein [Candidatus Hydrogenedentota bacterium]
MKHIGRISRMPVRAAIGGNDMGDLDPAETIVILLLSAFFQDWLNFPTVIQNLQKFYSKT